MPISTSFAPFESATIRPDIGSFPQDRNGPYEILAFARRRIPTLAILQREAAAWNTQGNRDCAKINWQFTRNKARQKFGYKR
jgi:hypothetical protein